MKRAASVLSQWFIQIVADGDAAQGDRPIVARMPQQSRLPNSTKTLPMQLLPQSFRIPGDHLHWTHHRKHSQLIMNSSKDKSAWLPRLAALLIAISLVSCGSTENHSRQDLVSQHYIYVLGTAQDGGLPQIGCQKDCCQRVRKDLRARRLVTSLLLVDSQSKSRWLFDASPDIKEQTEVAVGHPQGRHLVGSRPPLFEGIFLTHAHIGHYAGLVHLGRESYGSKDLPIFATKSMSQFLTNNGPWSLMVETGAIDLQVIRDRHPVALGDNLRVTPFLVPHRGEFTDTCGFLIEGPNKSLFYLPDIDKWDKWKTPIESIIAQVDYALIDGTFFADGEIPGRAMSEIPHPFIAESLARFKDLPASERQKIYFTHLNHTNPAAIQGGKAQQEINAHGMHVAERGMILGL
ncbi:MAG: pyrroloquinoline quinone biosynthesis protein B [Planctomycetota bacterium]